MKRILLVVLLTGAVGSSLLKADSASQADIESAWLAFAHARGEASLILGNVDHPSANDIFRVMPEIEADLLDEAKLQLGFDLFQERQLSRDGSISCNSCHVALMGGVDRRPVPFGIGGAEGTLNAPTIFNSALNFRQFWDGRALNLEEQALGPIENEIEFGHDLDGAVAALQGIPEYVAAFGRLYPDGITAANLSDAIAYYETMNFTGPSSPFLRQFDQEQNQLSQSAQRGQRRFVEVGCASCHNGVNLGGNSYQQLGVAEAWYDDERPADAADIGLYGRTGRAKDRHVFKVPSLHNVAITGPWLHDGSIASLQQAVDRMARYQLGRHLENEDIDDIVAFLRALGDQASMIGDCAVSGSYTLTMDCSMGQINAGVVDNLDSNQPSLPNPAVLTRQHRNEYSKALKLVAEAPTRIADEMQRIRSSEVAHFDFLQYEHLEMMRHARALSYPPANAELAQRESMLLRATELQQSALQYEIEIADFLRGFAVSNSARSNIQDLVRILSEGSDEKVAALLAQTEQNAFVYFDQPSEHARLNLERAVLALQGLDLNPAHAIELQAQVRLLVENVTIPQA